MFLLADSINGSLELLGMLIIFILILVATYYTTKWIGKSDIVNGSARNIIVLETYRISPGKVIQIVKTGKKYLVIGVTKEHIEMLTELSEDEYDEQPIVTKKELKFQDVLLKVKNEAFKKRNKKDEK